MASQKTAEPPPEPVLSWAYAAPLDFRLAQLAQLEDRRPEDAEEGELERVGELRAELLKAEGLEAPPCDWRCNFYHDRTLLRYLRAKGSKEEALKAVRKTIVWSSTTNLEMTQKHEQDPICHKNLMNKYTPEGPFGYDRRGAPVLYARLGLRDTAGLIRETSQECFQRFYMDKVMRNTFHFAVVNSKNERCGCSWMGSVFVMDLDGMVWSRGAATVEFMMWLSENALRDHFPEVTRISFIVNAPWFFSMGWACLAPFIAERTKSKFRIFGIGHNFMPELEEFVAPEQIPTWLGGLSPHAWPYGEGGDVPLGAGKLEAELASNSHRMRKPSWMKVAVASAAGTINRCKEQAMDQNGFAFRPDGIGMFDPYDRSIGLCLPRTPSSSSGASSELTRRRWSRGKAASGSAPANGAGEGQEYGNHGAGSAGERHLLEFLVLAFVTYGLYAWLRWSRVHSACASLGALLGASASLQLQRCIGRRLPSGRMALPPSDAAMAGPPAATKSANAAALKQQLPMPQEKEAAELSGSLRSDSGSSEASWVSSLLFAHRGTEPDGDAEPTVANASALPALVDVLRVLTDFAWTDCVKSWADRRGHSLQLCGRGPESHWKSDPPYRCLPVPTEARSESLGQQR